MTSLSFGTSRGCLALLLVTAIALGCSADVDGTTELTFNGMRYTGVVIPNLQIDDQDTTVLGLPERSGLGADRPVLELDGVDPTAVVVDKGQVGEETPWTLFVRYGLIGDGRNLFNVVPAMCQYAPPAEPECP